MYSESIGFEDLRASRSVLFSCSGTGVTMANAVQELKDIANYVTLYNDEDGIAAYLNEFILNENI